MPSVVARPRLENRLDDAFGRRLTTVVAGAGYGKTTLLAQWSAELECAWHTLSSADTTVGQFYAGLERALGEMVGVLPLDEGTVVSAPDPSLRADALAAHLATQLERSLTHDFVLVLDDAHELGQSPSARLVEGLVRQAPPLLHVVLASRTIPQFRIQRLRGQGQVLELDASDLAFDEAEVARTLELTCGGSRDLARQLVSLTGGWPAAVRLAIETLSRIDPSERPDELGRIGRPDGPLLEYLAEEVFGDAPEEIRALVRTMAPFERFSCELCEALGLADSRAAIESLRRQGLFLTVHRSDGGLFSLHTLVREFARDRLSLTNGELRDLHLRAAAWFAANGQLLDALGSYRASGDEVALARFLSAHGETLLAGGSIEPIVQAGRTLAPAMRDAHVEEIVGEAHSLVAEWDEALACYRRAAGDDEMLPPGLAWRMGRLYWDRGLLEEASAEYLRGRVDGSQPCEEAFLLAWASMPHWNLGRVDRARELAQQALSAATSCESPRALAAAHNALSVAYLGHDHALYLQHCRLARMNAEAAGDVLQLMRAAMTEAGPAEPLEALAILEEPIRLTELSGAALYLAALLNARGNNLRMLGRFDAAAADHRRALALFEACGSARRRWSLMNLGVLSLERGDLASTRAALEEAHRSTMGDSQGSIGVKRGLAALLAFENPALARQHAETALEEARRLGYMLPLALLTAGWVALSRNDAEAAVEYAREAAAETQREHQRLEFAEALELQAMADDDLRSALGFLEEAVAIWRDAGNEVAVARDELAIARLTGDRRGATVAQRTLRALGVRDHATGAAGLLACIPPDEPEAARVRTLGSFTVLRAGQPVALGEWRSRKPRDLLKILIARRGRSAPREYLMEALWPGKDPARLGNRLSVALSNLRTVLDPEKRFDPEHFVSSGKAGVALRSDNLPVDVEDFLADAEQGLALAREGRPEARDRLSAAEAAYAGDFLEEDAYEEWASGLREEARVTYTSVVRALAGLATAADDSDQACFFLVRLLERDPYDEPAHLELVAGLDRAGRHGEARRAYATYTARMAEIGIEAAPYPPRAGS